MGARVRVSAAERTAVSSGSSTPLLRETKRRDWAERAAGSGASVTWGTKGRSTGWGMLLGGGVGWGMLLGRGVGWGMLLGRGVR